MRRRSPIRYLLTVLIALTVTGLVVDVVAFGLGEHLQQSLMTTTIGGQPVVVGRPATNTVFLFVTCDVLAVLTLVGVLLLRHRSTRTASSLFVVHVFASLMTTVPLTAAMVALAMAGGHGPVDAQDDQDAATKVDIHLGVYTCSAAIGVVALVLALITGGIGVARLPARRSPRGS